MPFPYSNKLKHGSVIIEEMMKLSVSARTDQVQKVLLPILILL